MSPGHRRAAAPARPPSAAAATNPAVDVMSVKLQIPGQPAAGRRPAPGADPAAGHHGLAGDRQRGLRPRRRLVADPANPATITLRFSQADVMATPLTEVQVGHISDAGVMTKTPDCISGTLPPGAPYCVVRAGDPHRPEHLRHGADHRRPRAGGCAAPAPGETFDQTAPGAPAGPGRASSRRRTARPSASSWAPPANDGGAAVTAYRVYRDGKLVDHRRRHLGGRARTPAPASTSSRSPRSTLLGEGAAASADDHARQALQAAQGRPPSRAPRAAS